MKAITGLIGREDLVEKAAGEVRKGRHVLLTGPVGVGKSAVLEAVLERLERRRGERAPVDVATDDPPGAIDEGAEPSPADERRTRRTRTVIHVADHQPKAQFVAIARRLLAAGLLDPLALELPEPYRDLPPERIEWAKIRRHVNRLSMRDLTAAIIPALHDHPGKVLIAVDDLTHLTPTLVAFWLAVFDAAQVLGGANQKKSNLAKLWWKMTEIEIPPLPPEAMRDIVQTYIARQGMLIEAPGLFVGHVVQQSGGNPQAIADLLEDSSKERLVDKQRIRELRHAAGVRYFDFTPVLIVALASVVGVWQNGLIVEQDGQLRAVGPSQTHHNLYPLKARLIQGEPLHVVAERVAMSGHTLRGLVSRIDPQRTYYLLGEVEMPEGRGPALTGRLDRVDTYNPASSCLTGNPETS